MDVLSDILSGLRAAGSIYFCDFLVPPWELDYEKEARAMFHLVRRGRCRFEVKGESHDLEVGDFVFIAPNIDHRLSCDDESAPQTMLLCGYSEFAVVEDDVLLRALPEFVLLQNDELERLSWLRRTLEHLSSEYMSGAPGSDLTVNKLTEVLLVQLLREDFGRGTELGIVAALEDKRLAKALSAMHEDPGQHWTVDAAAEVASMSRSGFARRFKELLAQSFFEYLTRLRMRHARNLLTESSLPVPMIAERVGYQSDVSFVNAFKKLHGETPRAYRINDRSDP